MAGGALGSLVVSLEANIAKFEQNMAQALGVTNRTMSGIESAVGMAKTAMVGMGAALSVGALVAATKNAINFADEVGKMAQKTAMSTEAFSRHQYAADLAGLSTETLAKGVRELNRNLSDANAGSADAVSLFQSLGIAFKDAEGNVRLGDEALLDFAETFSKMPEDANKVNAAIRAFGQKVGPEMLPYLNQGRAGIQALGDELQRLGGVITPEAAREAERFNDNMRALEKSSQSLFIALGNNISPALADITAAMREAAKESGTLMSLWVGFGGILPNIFGNGGNAVRETQSAIEDVRAEIERLEFQKVRFGESGLFGKKSMAELEAAKALLAELEAKLKKLNEGDGKPKKSDNTAGALEAFNFLGRFQTDAQRQKKDLDQLAAYLKQKLISEEQYASARAVIMEKFNKDDEAKKKKLRDDDTKGWIEYIDTITREYEEGLKDNAKALDVWRAHEAKLQKMSEADWIKYIDALYDQWDKEQTDAAAQSKSWHQTLAGQWKGTVDNIEGGFRESFMRMLEGGKGWWKSFTQGLANTFKTTVSDVIYQSFAKPLTLNLVANLAQSMGMTGLQAAAQAAGGQPGGSPLSMLSSLGSLLPSGSMGTMFASGASSLASSFGASSALAGSIGTMASFVPVIGAVVAAVYALNKAFGDKGENWTGQLGFGASANAYTTNGMFGREGFAQIAGDDGLNKELQAFMARTGEMDKRLGGLLSASQIANISTALGGYNRRTDGQPAQFAFGKDDKTAGQQLTAEYLKVKYGAVFDEINPRLSAMIRGFTGTSEELSKFIGSLIQTQEMLKGMSSANALEDAMKQFEASRDPFTATLTRSRAALDEMMAAYDGSADSINALVQAQSQYYLSNVNLIAQISEIGQKISDMFAGTSRSIAMTGLSNPEQYAFLQRESESLYASLQSATSVSEIERLAQQLNANYGAAFGLLSPEEQNAQRKAFLDSIDKVNKETQEKLRERQESIAAESKKANDELRALLDKAGNTAQEAANTQLDAANTFAGAVSGGIRITVDANGNPIATEAGG